MRWPIDIVFAWFLVSCGRRSRAKPDKIAQIPAIGIKRVPLQSTDVLRKEVRSALQSDDRRRLVMTRACSAPIESGGFSWGQRWESLSALIRFWEAGRCRRPILGRCGNE